MLKQGQELFTDLLGAFNVREHTLIIKNRDLELDGRIFPISVLKDKITEQKKRTMQEGYFFCEKIPQKLSYQENASRYETCDFNNYFFRIKDLKVATSEIDGTDVLEATIESTEDNLKEIIDEYAKKGTECFFIRCRLVGKHVGDGKIEEDLDFSHIDFIKED